MDRIVRDWGNEVCLMAVLKMSLPEFHLYHIYAVYGNEGCNLVVFENCNFEIFVAEVIHLPEFHLHVICISEDPEKRGKKTLHRMKRRPFSFN